MQRDFSRDTLQAKDNILDNNVLSRLNAPLQKTMIESVFFMHRLILL